MEASEGNAVKIKQSLQEFGVPEDSINMDIFTSEECFFKLGKPPWRIDLTTSVQGISFQSLFDNSLEVEIDGIVLRIVSKSDLNNA